MARLFILASLMSASLMTQAAMPTWMPNFSGYFGKAAATHTTTSFVDTAKQKAAELLQAAQDDPFNSAIIVGELLVAIPIVVGGLMLLINAGCKSTEEAPASN